MISRKSGIYYTNSPNYLNFQACSDNSSNFVNLFQGQNATLYIQFSPYSTITNSYFISFNSTTAPAGNPGVQIFSKFLFSNFMINYYLYMNGTSVQGGNSGNYYIDSQDDTRYITPFIVGKKYHFFFTTAANSACNFYIFDDNKTQVLPFGGLTSTINCPANFFTTSKTNSFQIGYGGNASTYLGTGYSSNPMTVYYANIFNSTFTTTDMTNVITSGNPCYPTTFS
jgi:hypothetical protein